MNEEDLERRVRGWLHQQAAEPAPDALRRRVADVPRAAVRRRPISVRLALLATAAVVAAVATVAGIGILNNQPGLGAGACTTGLVDRAVQAFGESRGYAYQVFGTASRRPDFTHPNQDPILPATQIRAEGAYQSPALSRLTVTEVSDVTPPRPPDAIFPSILWLGLDSAIRIGDEEWWRGYGEKQYEPRPGQGDRPFALLPNPLHDVMAGADVGGALEWTAGAGSDFANGATCTLRGTHDFGSAPSSAGPASYILEVALDARSPLPIAIRERFDAPEHVQVVGDGNGRGLDVPKSYDVIYEVDQSAVPTVTAPPSPTP